MPDSQVCRHVCCGDGRAEADQEVLDIVSRQVVDGDQSGPGFTIAHRSNSRSRVVFAFSGGVNSFHFHVNTGFQRCQEFRVG